MTRPYQLSSRVLRGDQAGPRLLITGGVHGDEFEPMVAIRRLMGEIGTDQLRGTVELLPIVNEPAFRRGERTAEDGLDLARVCPGRADGSTTKQIAHALTETIRSADYYIDLHTGGRAFCVLPLTGYSLHADASVLDCQRRMAHAFNLGVVWGTKPLPGRSLSVAADAGIPAIYAEYFGAAICAAAGVEAYVAGCLNVMGELGMVDRTATESCVSVVVEDDGPDSGHMQMQNQAPMAGFFEPAVRLGDSVRVGDLLGTLTDTMGDRVEPMRSQQNGIVLVLRTFPMVDVGDSIGVVLPAPRDEKSKS